MQKKELEGLLPQMADNERAELLKLIEQYTDGEEKIEKDYQQNLGELNKEYDKKMDSAVKEQGEKARNEFEKMERKEAAKELKEFEGEIQAMPANAPKKTTATPAHEAHKHHTLRNTILTLLGIALIAGGILYTLV